MNRFKEKLKAIWHIIFDKEYVVATVSVKHRKRVRDCMFVSDNVSRITLEAVIKVLEKIKGVEYAPKELPKEGFTSKDVEELLSSVKSTPRNSLMYIKDIDKEIPKAFGADKNIPQDY